MRLLSVAPIIAGSIGVIAPIFQWFKVIPQGKRGVKYHLGRVKGEVGVGPKFQFPFVDKYKTRFVNEQTKIYDSVRVLLADQTQFQVKVFVTFKIVNLEDALVNIEDYESSIENLCIPAVQSTLRKRTWENLDGIDEELLKTVSAKAEKWGIAFTDIQVAEFVATPGTAEILLAEARGKANAKALRAFADEIGVKVEDLTHAQILAATGQSTTVGIVDNSAPTGRENGHAHPPKPGA
jgi:regulator of protease activity HflC (stomatin/prohibitin superfamily)